MKVRVLSGLIVGMTVCVLGCKVTSNDIENWKATQKGPDKLAAVLLDDRYDPQLRAEAAWALTEIKEWDKFDKSFKVIDAASRSRIAEALVPVLTQAIKEGNPPPSPPTAAQVNAKDALFVILEYLEGNSKKQAQDALIEWSVADLNNRFFAGRFSVEVILMGIGADAGDSLAEVLTPDFPAYDKVCEILARLGTRESKDKAGGKLVAMGREKEGKIADQLLVAMGRMGGREVRKYLLELGSDLNIHPRTQRGALMAYLQFKLCDQEDVELLFKIAENPQQDNMARNFAYDAVVCTGDKSQTPRLYKLLHEIGAKKDNFRGVGVDLILKLGGPETIPAIVGEIASEKDPWDEFEDLRDFVMVRFTQDGEGKRVKGEEKNKVLENIRPLVKSKDTLSRAIGLFTLGLIGEKADMDVLKKYANDGGKLTNWKSKEGEIIGEGGQIQTIEAMNFQRVGEVAGWAIREIKKREGG